MIYIAVLTLSKDSVLLEKALFNFKRRRLGM